MPQYPARDAEAILFAMGSGGDVYPTIGIGRALRDRGHRVLVVTNPYYESNVREAGLGFLGVGSEEQYRRRIEDPRLWQLGRGLKVLFADVLESMRPTYEVIRARSIPGRTVVVAPTLAFGARLAHERLGVPLVNIQLQPLAFRSLHEQPGLNVPAALHPVLPSLRRPWLRALDRWFLDPQVLPSLNSFRAELGLPPVRRVFDRWVYSPDLVIGLFPDWFAAPQPDWPAQARLTGFPLIDRGNGVELPPDITAFLAAGDPPIVFTLGTAMQFADRFFNVSVEVCRRLNRRGVLLTAYADQVPRALPSDVRHFRYVPFGSLLPRAAAIVHHGGIGTLAQALRAGIPQLVTPMNFDQPDNAVRLARLGVSRTLRLNRYTPAAAAGKLAELVGSSEVASRCRDVMRRFASGDPLGDTCRLIESVLAPAFARMEAM